MSQNRITPNRVPRKFSGVLLIAFIKYDIVLELPKRIIIKINMISRENKIVKRYNSQSYITSLFKYSSIEYGQIFITRFLHLLL